MNQIPPISTLPEPTKAGLTDDGWLSKVWIHDEDHALRIRHLRQRAILNVFFEGRSIRRTEGSVEDIVKWAREWFEERGWR